VNHRRLTQIDWSIIAALAAGVFILYAQTLRFEFVNYDDDQYVFENPHIASGLTWENVRWAFTSGYASNWHPLTWMSHMLDVELFGMSPAGPHGVNAAIHGLNAVLLFIAFLRMTGQRWPSAAVAAIFAVHPLRAESVAWISERKDVLSGLFFFLTLLLYERFVRARTWRSYLAVAVSLALGLMAKPMLVTLPFLLLLLDFWPLRRFDRWHDLARLSVEKLPLTLIAVASSIITFLVQRASGAVSQLSSISLTGRICNAIVSYAYYLRDVFWPAKLTFFYPHPDSFPAGSISAENLWLSVILLTAITIAALLTLYRAGWFATGWFWFVGTLVPVIGIVQVGAQARADRYTYVTTIGISIVVVYAANSMARRWLWLKPLFATLFFVAIAGLGVRSFWQIGTWRDSLTLTSHGISIDQNNYAAFNNLGHALDEAGDAVAAEAAYREVLRIRPEDTIALNNVAVRLAARGETREAISLYRAAIRRDPGYTPAIVQLANLYARERRFDAAISLYEQAIERDPTAADAHHNFAATLAEMGRVNDALEPWQRAISLRPNYADAYHGYGLAMVILGRPLDGIANLEKALTIAPDRIETLLRLSWIYATHPDPQLRNTERAELLATTALDLAPHPSATLLDTAATAAAAVGRFDTAVALADRAIAAASDPPLAAEITARKSLFLAGKPYIQGRKDAPR